MAAPATYSYPQDPYNSYYSPTDPSTATTTGYQGYYGAPTSIAPTQTAPASQGYPAGYQAGYSTGNQGYPEYSGYAGYAGYPPSPSGYPVAQQTTRQKQRQTPKQAQKQKQVVPTQSQRQILKKTQSISQQQVVSKAKQQQQKKPTQQQIKTKQKQILSQSLNKVIPSSPDPMKHMQITYLEDDPRSLVQATLYGKKLIEIPFSKLPKAGRDKTIMVPNGYSKLAVLVRDKNQQAYTVYFLNLHTSDGTPVHLPLRIFPKVV